MSSIGSGNLGALNLAGSVAGAQQTNAAADRIKDQASQRNSQINQKAMSSNALEDVGQADQTADRDADGRMAFGYDEEGHDHQANDDEIDSAMEDSKAKKKRQSQDAFGEVGISLDIEA